MSNYRKDLASSDSKIKFIQLREMHAGKRIPIHMEYETTPDQWILDLEFEDGYEAMFSIHESMTKDEIGLALIELGTTVIKEHIE